MHWRGTFGHFWNALKKREPKHQLHQKWQQQHEVYLVGDNGNAHHVRVYENNLFYIKLQLGAPGGVNVGAVADSIVRGASEIASEASSEATEALRACDAPDATPP